MRFQSDRNKYGSVSHDANDVFIVPAAAGLAAKDSFDLLRQERRNEGQGKCRKRWLSVAIIGALATGVMVGVAQQGNRLQTTVDAPSDPRYEDSLVETPEAVIAPTRGGGSSGGDRTEDSKSNAPFTPKQSSDRPASSSAYLAPLSFTALNFYHVRDGKPGADYPWLKGVKLIEPHRETTLTVTDPRDGFEYRWAINCNDPGKTEPYVEASGSEVVVLLTVLDENVITLEEVELATGKLTRRLEEQIMVKYVRREIRTLTEEEREELFDAMYTLWSTRVDGGSGRELYGENYADIYSINRLHFKAASPIDCDHFHDGLGFMTSHSLISNTFEYSLQRVNPKLTLPYWDFTIESSSAGAMSGETGSSILFSPTWFGTYDKDDNMVKDGRWAYTSIPKVMPNDPGGIAPDVYGRMRAPWNVNDRPYITRGMGKICGLETKDFYPWPTCATHYKLVTEYDSFYSYVWKSLYSPHGPIHVWIGGVLDCEQGFKKIRGLVGEYAAEEIAMFFFVYRKNLYRDGIFLCNGTADVSEKSEELFASGQCGCLGYDLTQGDDYIGIYDQLTKIDNFIGDASSDIKRQVVEIICSTPTNDGEHLQASSSLDPTFWPTHPTMERLWMFSVLTGHITDFTWPDSDVNYTDSEGNNVTKTVSLYGDDCMGHRGSDVFPFGLLATDIDDFTVKTGIRGSLESGNILTNRQVLQAFDPRSNSLPYVYDTFEWSHCDADMVSFETAWENAKKKPESTRENRPSF